jgi:hypothetical protein
MEKDEQELSQISSVRYLSNNTNFGRPAAGRQKNPCLVPTYTLASPPPHTQNLYNQECLKMHIYPEIHAYWCLWAAAGDFAKRFRFRTDPMARGRGRAGGRFICHDG